MDYLKGTMLANNNITLAEGPWNKMAYWDALERARERSAGKQRDGGFTRPGVVRRGPVLSAENALEIAGGGTLLEEQFESEGIGTEQADQLPMEMLPSGPIEVQDTPLRELGSSQSEMLSPKREQRDGQAQPTPKTTAPLDVPNQSILKPNGSAKLLQTIAPMSYETSSETDYSPTPVPRKPLPFK